MKPPKRLFKKRPSPGPKRDLAIAVPVGISIADLAAMADRLMNKMPRGKGERVYVAIPGYDDDPRGLWDIPEVIEHCKRLVNSGFIAAINLSYVLDHGIGSDITFLGGLELWMLGRGKISMGPVDVTEDQLDEFKKIWQGACPKLEALMLEHGYSRAEL